MGSAELLGEIDFEMIVAGAEAFGAVAALIGAVATFLPFFA